MYSSQRYGSCKSSHRTSIEVSDRPAKLTKQDKREVVKKLLNDDEILSILHDNLFTLKPELSQEKKVDYN